VGDGQDTAGAGVGAVPEGGVAAVADGVAETGCTAGALSPLVGQGASVDAKAGSGSVTLEPRLRNHADSNSRKIGNSIVSSGNAADRRGAGGAGGATGWAAGADGLGGAVGCEATSGGGL
jgi:hypothetical protein